MKPLKFELEERRSGSGRACEKGTVCGWAYIGQHTGSRSTMSLGQMVSGCSLSIEMTPVGDNMLTLVV